MSWAIELDGADSAACGPLRHASGIEAAVVADRLWLRGAGADEALLSKLRCLPALARYVVGAEGVLVVEGERLPHGRLPDALWQPLHACLPLEIPAVRRVDDPARRVVPRLPVSSVRGSDPGDPGILLVESAVWAAHAGGAPAIRLARWSFAASATGWIMVRGRPLPSLPGRRFVEEAGVAIEAGWAWTPRVGPDVLRALVGAGRGDLVILDRDGDGRTLRATIVPEDAFVNATRSAARLNHRAIGQESR